MRRFRLGKSSECKMERSTKTKGKFARTEGWGQHMNMMRENSVRSGGVKDSALKSIGFVEIQIVGFSGLVTTGTWAPKCPSRGFVDCEIIFLDA